jgi:hypothetical protein
MREREGDYIGLIRIYTQKEEKHFIIVVQES